MFLLGGRGGEGGGGRPGSFQAIAWALRGLGVHPILPGACHVDFYGAYGSAQPSCSLTFVQISLLTLSRFVRWDRKKDRQVYLLEDSNSFHLVSHETKLEHRRFERLPGNGGRAAVGVWG